MNITEIDIKMSHHTKKRKNCTSATATKPLQTQPPMFVHFIPYGKATFCTCWVYMVAFAAGFLYWAVCQPSV